MAWHTGYCFDKEDRFAWRKIIIDVHSRVYILLRSFIPFPSPPPGTSS